MNRTLKIHCLAIAVALIAGGAVAQQFPPLTISGTSLTCAVSYDSARQVYRYAYTINAPSTNLAPVVGFHLDLAGKSARTQLDPTLQNNIVRRDNKQPATTIPVGIIVPDPGIWRAGITPGGQFYIYSRKGLMDVPAGAAQGGIVIESHQPPGLRTVRFHPSTRAWNTIIDALPLGTELENPPNGRDYIATTTAIGPADLTDADFYSGGGQQPAEVNKFLRYTAPLDNRVKLPAGTTSYTVVVLYGTTIVPSTFQATLSGVDITSQFHPAPGGADAVTIPINGTTKLHLSVDGTKSSGGKGTDSDTLTFLP